MIDHKNIKLYLSIRFCARLILRIYWQYVHLAAYGEKFVSRLNRYVKNWIRWAKAGVGKVYLPNTILTHINFKLNNITPRPSCRAKILISNDCNSLKGMGSIGFMEKSMMDYDFISFLKEKFDLKYLRHSNLLNKKIKKVALVAGSGSFAIENAIFEKADCFISSDFKYHDFFKPNKKILIVDIGHYESERHIKETILNYLNKKIPKFACIIAKSKTNPVNYF